MGNQKRYKFGLRKKLVLFTSVLAIITYATSALFLYVIYPMIEKSLPFKETFFTVIVLVLGIIWSGILAFFAAGFIIKPLQKLERVALKAANGEIGEDVEPSGSDDEIRALGIAFNHMLANLREMVQQIEENFVETNKKVILISQESATASKAAESVGRTINEIAIGASQSAVAVQDTVEFLNEVVYLASEVQENSRSAERISNDMMADLRQSHDAIHSLVSGISEVAAESQQSLDMVKSLEANAAKVDEIIQLVGAMAAQTNLLALNASIEAVRAGEQGKGFAVVANEVRNLADESAKAAQDISELITNIQSDVTKVVKLIMLQVEQANRESLKGAKANSVMEKMTETVHQMAGSVTKITSLVDQQMESVKQTSIQSQEVAAIARQTSVGTKEAAVSTSEQSALIESVEHRARELKEQADKLKATITNFQV
ncbi:methyl-accepting chemotaxis protein [Pseudoneobacillus sp. C159]